MNCFAFKSAFILKSLIQYSSEQNSNNPFLNRYAVLLAREVSHKYARDNKEGLCIVLKNFIEFPSVA
jgi:hypothetical protein